MNMQLVKVGDKKWHREDGTPTWGLGVQVQDVSDHGWRGDDEYTERFGWLIEVLFGPWMLVVFTAEAWKGWHGPGYHPQPFFEYVKP